MQVYQHLEVLDKELDIALFLGILISLVWFVVMECYRGRPATSGIISFWLKFINPIGVIIILLVTILHHIGG